MFSVRCWSLTFIWQHSIQSWKWYQQVRSLCWISLCECTSYSACIPMYVFMQPTCVCEGGRPLRPYTPTRASLWTEMLNFKNCGWSMYSWDLQKTPVVKNNNKQNGVKISSLNIQTVADTRFNSSTYKSMCSHRTNIKVSCIMFWWVMRGLHMSVSATDLVGHLVWLVSPHPPPLCLWCCSLGETFYLQKEQQMEFREWK